ncbi:hypothetical protein [Intestinibacter sp.]|uniref:hypothetical protein n=1 Tax=Intestinibacter sp. TaxID=1965304 RepID=UPI003F161091
MAQVRKYSTGGETSPKLLKREGYGDYNVADIESQYAKSLSGILDEMGLEGEDRQKVIETTKNIMSNITNGTINTINSSGQWIVPKEYSSTGYNTYKNAGLFGIKGKKVVRDQNYYNNAAYYILDKVINGTNTYSPKKEDTKEKVNPDQSFEQYLSKYYFNNNKAAFDKKLWDYSTARQGIINRLKEYRDYISKSDMTDAAKTDYLSRIDSGITGLTDNINTNDYSSLARLGWSKPYMWLDEKFDEVPETAEQKAVREAKEKVEAETQAKQQALADQAAIAATTGSQYRPDLQSHYDRESNSTYYGSMNNGIFYPESRVTDELNENGERVQKTYKYTSPFIPSAFPSDRPIPFVEWENVNDENIGELLGITGYSTNTETDNSAERVNYYLRLAKMLGESSSTTDSQRSAIEKIAKWINSLKEREEAIKMAEMFATIADNKYKSGGILLAANGTTLTQKNDTLLKGLLNNYKAQETASTKIENQSGYTNSDKPHTEFSNADYVRMGALAGDVASLIASMTGVGSVASAGLGVASTAANQTADMMEGMSFLESLARNGGSYALDALSLIPFAKAAKVPKMIKNLGKIAPIITTVISGADAVVNGGEYLKSWNKVTNGESLSVNDWRNILNSLQLVTGGLAATHRASKGKSNVESVKSADEVWLKTDQGYRRVNNDLVSKLREAPDLKTQNELLKDTGIKLTESTDWKGKGIGKNKIKTQDLYDFNKQAVTYSGDLELHHNFGPGEKWLGNAQIDFSNYPKVQAAIDKVTQIPKYTRKGYNRVFHPQATKRANAPKIAQKNLENALNNLMQVQYTGKIVGNIGNRQLALPAWNRRADTEMRLTNNSPKLESNIPESSKVERPQINTSSKKRPQKQNIVSTGKKGKRGKKRRHEIGGIIEKYRQGNIIKYQGGGGVGYKEGTSWYRDVYLKMRDAMSTALNKGEIDAKTLNDLQVAHSALWNTASMGGRDFYTNPYINNTVGDYQTKFNNLSFGNNIGIKSAFDSGRYNIASNNPTSGDNYTKKWTVDNRFSGITDDRRVLGRKGDFNPTEELEEKAFWKNKGFDFYLDGDGYYKLSPIERDLTTAQTPSSTQSTTNTNPTTNQNTDTGAGAYNTDQESKVKSPYLDNLLAAGRLAGTLYTNNKVAKIVSQSLKPLELTPLRIRRQVYGDLPTRTFYDNQAAESNRIGARPITSDANLQLAQQLMYNDRALKLKTQGYLADKQAIDKTTLAAQQANEQNQASAVDVANKNRAAMLGIQQAKANIEASRRSANWQQAWNPFLSSIEQKYNNYSNQLNALNRDAANTAELRKLDAASKQAQSALDSARTNWLAANSGKSDYDWLNSDEYKNAYRTYETEVTNAGNAYKDTMSKYDLNNLRKPFSFLMFKSGGSTKDIAIENMKELNKTFRQNEELFHKIIMDSKKENNKLIMNLSSLTKELIIKSMTI